MSCDVSDARLSEFAAGGAPELEEHVASCERCQERLAELFEGPPEGLVEKTMRAVRMNVAGRDLLELAFGLLGAYGAAVNKYTLGGDQ